MFFDAAELAAYYSEDKLRLWLLPAKLGAQNTQKNSGRRNKKNDKQTRSHRDGPELSRRGLCEQTPTLETFASAIVGSVAEN